MALIPLLLDYLEQQPRPVRPSRIYDQHFGQGLSHADFLSPLTVPRDLGAITNRPPYYRPWRSAASGQDIGSTVTVDPDSFKVNLDVQQFAPEEIQVKVTGENCITVEGKHEEKEDEHGFVYRHFIRRYFVPKGHNVDKVESHLSSDGVLSIIAPKIAESKEDEHRPVPIKHTGKPSRPVAVEPPKAKK